MPEETLDDMTPAQLANRVRENTGGSRTGISSEMALRELQYRAESAAKMETKAQRVGNLVIALLEEVLK